MSTIRNDITWTDAGEDAAIEAMNAAINDGYAELVCNGWYLPKILKNNDTFTTRTMGEADTATVKRSSDGKKLRIWRTYKFSPEDYCKGIIRFKDERPDYTSPTVLGQQLLREGHSRKAKNPRWQLQDDVNWLWDLEQNNIGVLSSQRWGMPRGELSKLDRVEYDKNKAYLTAFTQARLAPAMEEGWTRYINGKGLPELNSKVSGMVKIEVPQWDSILPNPSGNKREGNITWTSVEIMKLYHEFDVYPKVLDAFLSPAATITAMNNLTKFYRNYLDKFSGDEVCTSIIKSSYASFSGIITSRRFSMKRPDFCYRPDWGVAIRDNSWANCCRMARKIYLEDERFVPLALNIDALYYPAGLPVPPVLPLGDKIGNFKMTEHKGGE